MIYIFSQPLFEVSVTGMPFVSPVLHDGETDLSSGRRPAPF